MKTAPALRRPSVRRPARPVVASPQKSRKTRRHPASRRDERRVEARARTLYGFPTGPFDARPPTVLRTIDGFAVEPVEARVPAGKRTLYGFPSSH
jgi:hypothetical protein